MSDSKTEAGRRVIGVAQVLQDLLLEQVKGLPGEMLMFRGPKGKRDRTWPRFAVQKLCVLAGVPVVTAHGMRGLHSTLALQGGSTGDSGGQRFDPA